MAKAKAKAMGQATAKEARIRQMNWQRTKGVPTCPRGPFSLRWAALKCKCQQMPITSRYLVQHFSGIHILNKDLDGKAGGGAVPGIANSQQQVQTVSSLALALKMNHLKANCKVLVNYFRVDQVLAFRHSLIKMNTSIPITGYTL